MLINILKSKIHRATITQAELNYIGSITVDEELLNKSDICEYEQVHVVDINNGNRFVTYVIKGERNSGIICLNGAAARLVQVNDKIIIMAYALIDHKEKNSILPKILFVDERNKIINVKTDDRCEIDR